MLPSVVQCIMNTEIKDIEKNIGEQEFKIIADLIYKVIRGLSVNKSDNSKIEQEVKNKVINLCSSFPIYDN